MEDLTRADGGDGTISLQNLQLLQRAAILVSGTKLPERLMFRNGNADAHFRVLLLIPKEWSEKRCCAGALLFLLVGLVAGVLGFTGNSGRIDRYRQNPVLPVHGDLPHSSDSRPHDLPLGKRTLTIFTMAAAVPIRNNFIQALLGRRLLDFSRGT